MCATINLVCGRVSVKVGLADYQRWTTLVSHELHHHADWLDALVSSLWSRVNRVLCITGKMGNPARRMCNLDKPIICLTSYCAHLLLLLATAYCIGRALRSLPHLVNSTCSTGNKKKARFESKKVLNTLSLSPSFLSLYHISGTMGSLRDNPIFKTKESIATLSVISLECILICILEGLVVMNHLALVSNCQMDTVGQGEKRQKASFRTGESCSKSIYWSSWLLGVSESDLIYHSLFIVAQAFQVLLCVDALLQRNTGTRSLFATDDVLLISMT